MAAANGLALFGVLNINKPAGMTSRDVVNCVQRLVRPLKCGHAGTLDPMATGVLLVCIGHATRLTDFLHLLPKTYVAEFTFGVTSDTDDAEGRVTETPGDWPIPERADVERALASFVGTIQQVPPQVSAVHVDGERAYRIARRGEVASIAAKTVEVHSIEVTAFDWPRLQLRITCGSGTYVRSIARDLGQSLGCGGLMSSLVRTAIGSFVVETACDLASLDMTVVTARLVPAAVAIGHLPSMSCVPAAIEMIRKGRALSVSHPGLSVLNAGDTATVALVTAEEGRLIAIAERQTDGFLQPRQVFL